MVMYRYAATISLDSSLKRAERSLYKMKTTITFHICNLFHLCLRDNVLVHQKERRAKMLQ
jgi:hypothetical protein